MAYGTLAVDYILYTSNSTDTTATVSSVFNGEFPAVTTTGTLSGNQILAASGTVTGTLSGGNILASSGSVTGTLSGGHLVGTSGTLANFVVASGVTVTGTGIPTNGLYSPGSGQVGLSSSGISRFTINSSGRFNVSASYQADARTVSALNIDCTSGNYYIKTITGSSTFTVSNAPASGSAYSFTLEVIHTSGTITWFSGLEWPGGTAPTLTTGKTHLFMFLTDDGGSRWRGSSLINYTT
jgi:hypothetical protein